MKAIELYNTYVGRAVAFLGCVCAVSVFAYGVFLLMAVAHAAHLSAAQEKIRTLTSELSAAENRYLAETQSLDLASAQALGLVKPSSVSIVYAPAPSSLTFNR